MTTSDLEWPDGIGEDHIGTRGGWARHAGPLSLVVLALAMAFGLSGLAGRETTLTQSAGSVEATWHAPERIRNGEFFEIRLTVEAADAIDELVIGVAASVWEDFTINTFMPAATEEASEDGELRFAFGPLEPDTAFLLKVDAQINPDAVGANRGAVTIYDGDAALLELPVSIEVLP